jgi:hypothetical protein
MGADFMFQILPLCRHSIDREIELVMAVEEAAFEQEHGDKNVFMFDFDYFWDEVELDESKEDIIETISKDYWNLQYSRDVGTLIMDDVWYILTGGMGWGDDPTDSYYPMSKLNGLWDLFEKFAKEDREKSIAECFRGKQNGST